MSLPEDQTEKLIQLVLTLAKEDMLTWTQDRGTTPPRFDTTIENAHVTVQSIFGVEFKIRISVKVGNNLVDLVNADHPSVEVIYGLAVKSADRKSLLAADLIAELEAKVA